VPTSALQEVYTAMRVYDCQEGVVVTNSLFTAAACELGKKIGITLHDGDWLAEQVRKYLPPEIPEFNWDVYNRVVKDSLGLLPGAHYPSEYLGPSPLPLPSGPGGYLFRG
jgi:hypothetical protein